MLLDRILVGLVWRLGLKTRTQLGISLFVWPRCAAQNALGEDLEDLDVCGRGGIADCHLFVIVCLSKRDQPIKRARITPERLFPQAKQGSSLRRNLAGLAILIDLDGLAEGRFQVRAEIPAAPGPTLQVTALTRLKAAAARRIAVADFALAAWG